MKWSGFKSKKKDDDDEENARAIVRQDPRTNVKTTTAQSETTNTTTKNSTIFNNYKKTVTYQSTKQTVTSRQTARITEITSRRTPTPEELEEMMRLLHMNKKAETKTFTTSATTSSVPLRRNNRPTNLPALPSTQRNSQNGISPKSATKFKSSASPISRLIFNYDSPPSTANGGGGEGSITPKTPTLVKTSTTTVTEKNGRTVTQRVEEHRIKFDPKTFKLPTPNSPLTRTYPSEDSYTFSTDARPMLALPAPASTKTYNTKPTSTYATTYTSPYKLRELNRVPNAATTTTYSTNTKPTTSSIYSSTTKPTTTSIISNTTSKATTKPTTSSIYSSTTKPTTTSIFSNTTSKATTKPTSSSIFSNSASKPTTTSIFSGTTTKPTTNSIFNSPTTKPISSYSYTPPKTTTPSYNFNISKPTPLFTSSTPSVLTKPTASTTLLASGKSVNSPLCKPGYAYIFNNVVFDNPNNEERIGSAEDVKSLVQSFEYYKLKVTVIENAKVDKIRKTVEKIQSKDFKDNACLVIVILSHGARHEEIAAKDGHYSVDDHILFPILRNPTLNDKPKLFFIQACKGSMETNGYFTDAVPFSPHGGGSANEILKCYSTFEGFVSYRTEKGSMFIQALCQNLKLFGSTKSIKDIMELVTQIVKQQSQNKQIPAYTSTLTKPFIFGDYIKWPK